MQLTKGVIDIIIAKNIRDAEIYFHKRPAEFLPDNYPINRLVGLIENGFLSEKNNFQTTFKRISGKLSGFHDMDNTSKNP